jgi:hypothetical protein
VSRTWLVSCLLLALACSDRGVPSGSVALPAGDEPPTLILRCQNGRVGAFLVAGGSLEAESGALPDQVVEVELDSAVSCSEDVP